jgi:hypothetical protein
MKSYVFMHRSFDFDALRGGDGQRGCGVHYRAHAVSQSEGTPGTSQWILLFGTRFSYRAKDSRSRDGQVFSSLVPVDHYTKQDFMLHCRS